MNLALGNPALLWGLLAAAIPLVVHLFFRRRPRPTPFPAIDFVLRARKEQESRLRLRKILLFAARTLLLLAVAAALLRPKLESPGAATAAVPVGPRATAIVLDASGSMRYRLGGKALFERARSDALGALTDLTTEEPATVVVCGAEAPRADAPAFDRGAVRRALEAAAPSAAYADLTNCVAEAARALGADQAQAGLGKRIVVATDLAASAWRLDAKPPQVDGPNGPVTPEVTVLDAARGAALPNASISGLGVVPDFSAGPRGYRVNVQLSNAGEARKDASLTLSLGTGKDAKTVIRSFVDLPADAAAKKSLALSFPQGGPALVRVALPPDGLAEDDTRALPVLVPREVRALVVDGSPSPVRFRDEAIFVDQALSSPASPVRARVVDAEAFPAEDLSKVDVVMLLNVRDPTAKAADLVRFVENGGGLFVSVGDQVDVDAWAKALPALLPMALNVEKTAADRGQPDAAARAARFDEVDFQHPALSIFGGEAKEGLMGVRTYRYLTVKPISKGPAAHVMARFDDGSPALVEARRGKGRVLLFTSTADRDWTDWPIRTSYLPAMQRFAGWLAGGLEERRETPVAVGEPRRLVLEEGEALAGLLAPDGRELRGRALERALGKDGDGTPVFRPDVPGLWQAEVAASGVTRLEPRLAFSATFDPRESDTRRLSPDELAAHLGGAQHAKVEGDAQAAAGGKAVPLWTILLALGLAAFFLEGLLIS
ncbi:MAG: BatA domain-containing protein [Anaeromyxobacter sp.]